MKIGIVGLGIVGNACKKGFDYLGYDTIVHDIKFNSKIEDLLSTEITYVCVPTPSLDSGGCDTSIVCSVVDDLMSRKYKGIVAIKSTISPGTTEKLQKKYNKNIIFVPEFLKERSAEFDFIHDHKLLLVGTTDTRIFDIVKRSHGSLPQNIKRVKPSEAELVKYYHNSFNALRVVFANVFFEMAKKIDADYDVIKDSFLLNNNIPDEYLDVNDSLRGYSGACLPKDVLACRNFCIENNLDFDIFSTMISDNSKFIPTVFDGMRDK